MEETRIRQIDKVLNSCRTAYHSNMPIIYLLTDEMEIADEIVNSEALIPFMHLIPSDPKAITVYEAFQYENESTIHEKDINLKKILPYLKEQLVKSKEETNPSKAVSYLLNKMPEELRRLVANTQEEAETEKANLDVEEHEAIHMEHDNLIHKLIDFLNKTILPDSDYYDKDRFSGYQKQIYHNQQLRELCRSRKYSDQEIRKRNRLLLGYVLSDAFGRMPEYYDTIDKVSIGNKEVGYSLSNFFSNYDTFRAPRIGVIKNFNLNSAIDNQLSGYIHAYDNAKNNSYVKKSILILAAPVLKISVGFEPYVEVVKVPRLEDWEIYEIITGFIENRNKPGRIIEMVPNQDYINKLIASLRGFGKRKILEILQKIVLEMGGIGKNFEDERRPEEIALEIIESKKRQMLEKSGVLYNVEVGDKPVGGLKALKTWIENRKPIFDNVKTAKDEWNIDSPKGILISGVPGTGKTLMAKETARLLKIPLIKMDMGALMGGHMGESEENMRRAISMAESMSPCVLWIDELEKGFSGAKGSGSSDGGTFKRVFASFLTWMQDKESPCFIFATANDISQLPPEFLRRGRFDQKFYAFMPMERECIDIFKAVIRGCNSDKKRKKGEMQLFEESIMTDGFIKDIVHQCGKMDKFLIGADIDGIVRDAMAQVYFSNSMKIAAPGEYRYKRDEFERALFTVLRGTKTYGETNLSDIATCFISLYENKFIPASGSDSESVLIDFSSFDPKRDPAIELADREENSYNGRLFNKIKGEINRQIHEKLEYKKNY